MMGNILAIDRGRTIIGLASKGNSPVIMPVGSLTNTPTALRDVAGIVAQKNISTVVLGLPAKEKTLQIAIKKRGSSLKLSIDPLVEIVYVNEDYSSVQAGAVTGNHDKDHTTDTLAAMVILQNYLDSLT